jgi:hypothetical protein
MKVFISWSGNLSQQLAAHLRDWLPSVLQRVQPYFAPKDIDKGSRWLSEISFELSESNFGVICVTPDNMEASWIMFEAGAISAKFDQSRICPILFGMNKKDLRGPLFQFQAIEFDKSDIKALVASINTSMGEEALSESALERIFEKWWPELEHNVMSTLREEKPQRPPEKSAEERHTELLTAISAISEMRRQDLSATISEDLLVNLYANVDAAVASQSDCEGLAEALSMLVRNVEYIHYNVFRHSVHIDRASRVLERIAKELPPACRSQARQ